MAKSKNNFFKKSYLFIFLFFISQHKSNAQLSIQDSAIYQQTNSNVIALFQNTVKVNSGLFNGSEYLYSGHNVKGFPYFKSSDFLNGSVFYDGNLYNNVQMHFDLVTNELIIPDYTKNFPIKLITSKIDYFFIDSNLFINAAFSNNFLLPKAEGFYEELYNDKSAVFAKKQKQLVLSARLDENDNHYTEFDWYYIYTNNKLFKVDNEKSVLNVFADTKTDLKKFIKSNKISFKKNFEVAVVRTVAYYDQIKNQNAAK